MISHYKMAAAYAGPVVALDRNGVALAVEHLPEFVLASDYDALAARLAEAERLLRIVDDAARHADMGRYWVGMYYDECEAIRAFVRGATGSATACPHGSDGGCWTCATDPPSEDVIREQRAQWDERLGPDDPPWKCTTCNQMNSAWAVHCGRCDEKRLTVTVGAATDGT